MLGDAELVFADPDNGISFTKMARNKGSEKFVLPEEICRELEFSLIGVLAGISKVLAQNKVGIFVISTYNTDYILVKEESFEKAVRELREAGYGVKTQQDLILMTRLRSMKSGISARR